MPDAFTLLESITRRALGSIPSNSFVSIEPPRRTMDIARALSELTRAWIEGRELRVAEVLPLEAPARVVEEVARELEQVIEEISRSDIASLELAYAIAQAAAALCISAGRKCIEIQIVEKARRLARSMARRSRASPDIAAMMRGYAP